MSMNLKYTPEKMDNAEFHRIREWHNTFNTVVKGLLASNDYFLNDPGDRRLIRREARKFANSVHGSISKTPKRSGFSGVLNYSNTDRWNY